MVSSCGFLSDVFYFHTHLKQTKHEEAAAACVYTLRTRPVGKRIFSMFIKYKKRKKENVVYSSSSSTTAGKKELTDCICTSVVGFVWGTAVFQVKFSLIFQVHTAERQLIDLKKKVKMHQSLINVWE